MKYRGGGSDDWLFCSVYGEKLTKGANYTALWDYSHARGLNKTGVHRYRHTFAKKWVTMGGSIVTLQKIEYADAYTFEQTYSMLSMAPLSEAEDKSIAITVSDVIENDDTSDLKIVIKGSSFGVEEDYTYYLNPMDATQTEKVYQKAKFFDPYQREHKGDEK